MPKQNVQKFNEPVLAPDFLRIDGTSIGGGGATPTAETTAGDAGTSVEETALAVQRAVFTLDITDGDWLNATDTVNITLGSFGRPVLVLATSGDLLLTKKGSLLTTTDIDIGIGTVAADGTPFVTNEDILLEKLDFNEDTLSLDMEWNPQETGTNRNTGQILPLGTEDIILNMYANVGADSTFDLSGTITIYFVDMGTPA